MLKFVPRPSCVAPRGYRRPGLVSIFFSKRTPPRRTRGAYGWATRRAHVPRAGGTAESAPRSRGSVVDSCVPESGRPVSLHARPRALHDPRREGGPGGPHERRWGGSTGAQREAVAAESLGRYAKGASRDRLPKPRWRVPP